MGKVVNAHVKEYGQQMSTGVPVQEAVGANFRAGDFVKVVAGRCNLFNSTVASDAVQLAVANSDAQMYWKGEKASWWPAGRGTQYERGHILYSVTKDCHIVMSLEGNAPGDIQTLIGEKRDISWNATFETVMVKATSAAPRVQIIGILEGANGEANPTLLVSPLLDGDNWFNAS